MGSAPSTLSYAVVGAYVARITLCRPDKRNAINPQMIAELFDALATARDDAAVRVVVLSGAGTTFCAGGDLAALAGDGPPPPGGSGRTPVSRPRPSLGELFTHMHALGKPIIARVDGPAVAGGLGLMVACDLVVASDRATFGTPEILVGLWPMLITAELVRNIGRKKALELMLTGERIDAAEAQRIGLVNRVVPVDALDETTDALARQLASRSPAVIARGLAAFYATAGLPLADALASLEGRLDEVLALEDAREGLAAFAAKRAPAWKGR